jgi:hypothetical protein
MSARELGQVAAIDARREIAPFLRRLEAMHSGVPLQGHDRAELAQGLQVLAETFASVGQGARVIEDPVRRQCRPKCARLTCCLYL